LPDGIFSNQISQLGYIFVGPWNVKRWHILRPFGLFHGHWVYLWQFGIFYGNLVYFMAIWYILWQFGIFSSFVIIAASFLSAERRLELMGRGIECRQGKGVVAFNK
jgi:hypothetical protein